MSTNPATLMLPDRFVADIDQLKRDLLEIKTKQNIGGDNTVVTGTNIASSLSTIPAGNTLWQFISVTPTVARVTLWDFFFSLYIDSGTAVDINYIFPSGALLTAGQKKLRVYTWADWGSSDDISGMRKYAIGVENYDSVSHQVALVARLFSIKTAAS